MQHAMATTALRAALLERGTAADIEDADRLARWPKFVFDVPGLDRDAYYGASDFADDLAEHGLLKLPFPEVVFIAPRLLDHAPDRPANCPSSSHVVLAAWHDAGDIFARLFFMAADGSNSLATLPATYWFPFRERISEWTLRGERGGFIIDAARIAAPPPENLLQITLRCAGVHLASCLGLLSAGGIKTEEVAAPKFTNAMRAKKGKPPLDGYHLVSIDYAALKIPGVTRGGTHASPRLHWRRGHIRTLQSGAQVTVRPCLVGDPERGRIEHDYRLRPAS